MTITPMTIPAIAPPERPPSTENQATSSSTHKQYTYFIILTVTSCKNMAALNHHRENSVKISMTSRRCLSITGNADLW